MAYPLGFRIPNDAHTCPTADTYLRACPAPDAGTLRTTRTAKHLTLQQAADALHVWPTALSRLECGLSRDDVFHQRYETWLREH